MATKTLHIKRKKKIVLAPKSLSAVHDDSEAIVVPDDAFVSQSVQDVVAAKQGNGAVLPQGLQTSHFFDAYLAESQKLKHRPAEKGAVAGGQETAQPASSREVLGMPTFKFFCYRCGQKLQVPISWANKMQTCGCCGHEIRIPPPLTGDVF
jgi:hypothetical protein